MTKRYASYFFWTVICVMGLFIFFGMKYHMNLFSPYHWKLAFKNFSRLPALFFVYLIGGMGIWFLGLKLLMRKLNKKSDDSMLPVPQVSLPGEEKSVRPTSVASTNYMPEDHHYQPEKKSFQPPVQKPIQEKKIESTPEDIVKRMDQIKQPSAEKKEAPQYEVPPAEKKNLETKTPEDKQDVKKETPASAGMPEQTKEKTTKVEKEPEKNEKKAEQPSVEKIETGDIQEQVKSVFESKNIKTVPPFRIDGTQIEFYGLTDEVLYIGASFKPEEGMVVGETQSFEGEATWMNRQKERIDSPPAKMLEVLNKVQGMCEKAFKGKAPFEIKSFLMMENENLSQLDMLKDKYAQKDLHLVSLSGDQLPSLESILKEGKQPSQSFIDFSATLANYFDDTYKVEEEEA